MYICVYVYMYICVYVYMFIIYYPCQLLTQSTPNGPSFVHTAILFRCEPRFCSNPLSICGGEDLGSHANPCE